VTTSAPSASLHTYMVQRYQMRIGWPLRFSDGERIIAVLSSEPVPLSPHDLDVTVLVEMPAGYRPPDRLNPGRKQKP
jgi:hypothetical protein